MDLNDTLRWSSDQRTVVLAGAVLVKQGSGNRNRSHLGPAIARLALRATGSLYFADQAHPPLQWSEESNGDEGSCNIDRHQSKHFTPVKRDSRFVIGSIGSTLFFYGSRIRLQSDGGPLASAAWFTSLLHLELASAID